MRRKLAIEDLTPWLVILALSCATGHQAVNGGTNQFGPEFWQHWGDGRAELAGYDLVMPRYGELRRGTAIAIFVTEPFSDSLRVKADPGKHRDSDVFQVLKLNLVRDFPTGIYDYNLMTSAFVAVQPVGSLAAGMPAKISFTAQEWCGHVFQQVLVRPPSMSYQVHSYFDGEADQQKQNQWRAGGIAEDTLFFWARGLGEPFMRAGERRTVPLLQSLGFTRLAHAPMVWRTVTLSVGESAESVSVPGGQFETEVRTAEIDSGRKWTFYVERSAPRRIIKWTVSDGEQGELLRSERLPYWKMNAREFESAVEKLGLTSRGMRMP